MNPDECKLLTDAAAVVNGLAEKLMAAGAASRSGPVADTYLRTAGSLESCAAYLRILAAEMWHPSTT